MFPFHEDKVKSDEYGEIINYEDFMDIRNTHSIISYDNFSTRVRTDAKFEQV